MENHEGAEGHTGDSFRLSERQRTWRTPDLPTPPRQETDRLLADRWVALTEARQRVADEIDARRNEFVTLLQNLVRIPSVNPSPEWEKPLAQFVAQYTQDLGMEVRQHEPETNRVSNLARLSGTGGTSRASPLPNLLYYAHLDTVPAGDERNWRFPPFSATLADGRLYGRGAKDCKLGMAAALAAAAATRSAGIALAGDLLLVTPADEETGGHLGIASMIDAGWLDGIAACIYGEGAPDRLTIGANGGVQFRVTTHGRSAHTAWKHLGVNAILQACALAPLIDGLTFDDCPPHPIVRGQPVASVNMIAGGFKLNVVPDTCSFDVDLRFPPGYTETQALAHVTRAIKGLRADERYHDLEVELQALSVMRPYAVSPDQPVVMALAAAVSEATGHVPEATGMPASSDARWIYLDGRIPIVNCSFGNASGHLPNEYVDLEGYLANIKAYAWTNLLLLA